MFTGIGINMVGQMTATSLQALLFYANEPGFTFEPWDISTLFQDRAGTTPVTAAGQSVGLRLSKDQGLRQGPEQSANPGNPFTSTAGFTAATSTISLVAGRIKTFIPAATSGASGIYWDTTVTANKAQKIVMDLEAEGRTFEVRIYNGASFATLLASDTISAGVRRNVSFTVTPTTSAVRVYILEASGADRSVYLASVSVRELAGNHEVAVSDAKRGVYGWIPKTGRRNQATYTSQFANAAWLKFDASYASGKFTEGTGASIHRLNQADTIVSGQNYVWWVEVQAAERTRVLLRTNNGSVDADTVFDLSTGTIVSGTGGVVALAGGWYRVWRTFTAAASVTSNFIKQMLLVNTGSNTSYTGDGTSGVMLRFAQFEVGTTPSAAQEVVSQYEITEAGVPTCYYVQADGVDDAYVTPTITPNTDKVQVFAGVRKLSDAATGIFIEHGTSSLDPGSLYVTAPELTGASGDFRFKSRGSVNPIPVASGTMLAPTNKVITGLGDISGDTMTLRVNGTQVAQSTADQGTGNFLAYPAYIYGRAGTSLPFNGLDFGHAVRFGPNLDATTIARVESLIARNTPEVTL